MTEHEKGIRTQEVQAVAKLARVVRVAVTKEITPEYNPGYLKHFLDRCYSWCKGHE